MIEARCAEGSPEQTATPEELDQQWAEEVRAAFAPYVSTSEPIDPPRKACEDKTVTKDAAQLFRRKVGVALTRDNRLHDALTNLCRHEASLINGLTRTLHLLLSCGSQQRAYAERTPEAASKSSSSEHCRVRERS